MKYVCIILACAALASCRPARVITERVVESRDTTIYIPGATVRDTMPGVVIHSRDSVRYFTERVVVDPTGRAELRYLVDAVGRLHVEARCKPDTVFVPRVEVRTRDVERVVEHRGWLWYDTALAVAAGVLLIVVLFMRR